MSGFKSSSTKSTIKHYLVITQRDENLPLKKPGTIQKVQNPYPVSKATLQEYKDSYQSIFHDKRNYTKRLQKALRMYNSHKKFKHSWDTNSQGVIKIPVFLKDICTDGFKDPDCYFSEDNAYNWYFTGGVLDCFERNDYKYLLHWKADEGITISDLNGPGIHLILGKLKHHDVYCLKTYVTDYDIFITAREKNSVYLYRTDIKDNFTLDTILDINHLTSEDKPFFDFKLNRFSFMSFATCNAGQEVCIRDVAGTVISSRQLEELSSFCQMEYISSDRLVICQSKDLHFSDTRLQEMDKATLSLEPCQDICLMSPVDEKYLYIASTHDFMKFDIRSRKIVYRYSHLMKQPPHLMSVLREDGETTICLGNQDSKVLLYDCDSRYTTPLHVPNIQDTFKQMQLYSRFFLHVEDVEERLKSSNIGLVTVKLPNGSSYIYSSNAAGDLFQQQIITESASDCSPETNLSSWVSSIPPKEPPKLIITNLVELSHVRRALDRGVNCRWLNSLRSRHSRIPKTISRYQDGSNELAKALEDAWLESEPAETVVPLPTKEIKYKTKVSAWLQSHDFMED